MDVNGTHFHLVQGGADWARCVVVGDPTIALADGATLRPLLFQFAAPAGPALADPAARRRGAARDRYGNWYWVDDSEQRVAVRSVGSDELGTFWPAPRAESSAHGAFTPAQPIAPPAPCRFGGLVITDDHYLIVGTLDQPGILVFDLHAGGLPRHLLWPAGVPFQPFDMAPRPAGGLLVLDRSHRLYWALDRHLGVIEPASGSVVAADPFRPADGRADPRPQRASFPRGVAIGAASPIDASDPVAIDALPDGTVLILDRLPSPRVLRYRSSELIASALLDLGPVLDPAPSAAIPLGADLAFVPGADGAADRLYVPAANGEQVYAFTVAWVDVPLGLAADRAAPFLPMRLFGGKGLVAADRRVYYDFGDEAWLPLVEQRRPRFERDGTFETPAFDGREPGCVWHRLFLDGCVPSAASVEVWSRVADEASDLPNATWFLEPAPRRRPTGPELPLVPLVEARSDSGTFELLFQRARGRWLQLRFRLRGDGRTSPRFRALRIWYPRFSYLDQYLPALYRQDTESASFLDRFLANLEGLFTSVEDKVAVAQMLFDGRTAPADALDWLAGWFGIALDPAWTEAKRRLFLRHAMDFFRTRGTVRGLQTALRLVIDECADDSLFTDASGAAPSRIRILEAHRLRELPPLTLGDPNPASGIRQTTTAPRWTPEQGGAVLLALYRAAVVGSAGTVEAFPVFEPGDGTASQWHQFLRDVLSLASTAAPSDASSWHGFLSSRYSSAAALNDAWRTTYGQIADAPLPASLPPDGPPLFDWYQFQLRGGRFVASKTRWIPVQGRDALSDRWRQFAHANAGSSAEFPVVAPADASSAVSWRQFASDVLGFVPASGTREQRQWQDFLARRYRRIGAFNLAYGVQSEGFSALTLPGALPADGAPLRDWYDFQSLALNMRRLAHRFTVLLPVPAREAFALTLHQQRRDLATRIIELEKPAHTLFDVKFYWAMFRVGEARLQIDTLLDQSSRAPELLPPAVLGQAFLAQSRLASTPPERETERSILGSLPLRSRPKPEEKTS